MYHIVWRCCCNEIAVLMLLNTLIISTFQTSICNLLVPDASHPKWLYSFLVFNFWFYYNFFALKLLSFVTVLRRFRIHSECWSKWFSLNCKFGIDAFLFVQCALSWCQLSDCVAVRTFENKVCDWIQITFYTFYLTPFFDFLPRQKFRTVNT